MPKTYPDIGTFTAGQVLTAATMNDVATNLDNNRSPAMCRATTTGAAQTVNFSTDTAIQFNGTDLYDTDAMHDPATNNTRITLQTAGIYIFHAGLLISAGAAGNWTTSFKVDNTTTFAQMQTVGNEQVHLLSAVYSFTAGQYVELIANIANTRTITRDARTFFAASFVGQTA